MIPLFPFYKDGANDINLFTNSFNRNSQGTKKMEIKKMEPIYGDMYYLLQ